MTASEKSSTKTPASKTPQTKLVKGPGETEVELTKWYVSPMFIPTEMLERVKRAAMENDVSVAEYVFACTLYGVPYDKESVLVARRLCFTSATRNKKEQVNA